MIEGIKALLIELLSGSGGRLRGLGLFLNCHEFLLIFLVFSMLTELLIRNLCLFIAFQFFNAIELFFGLI